jgi:hypothetical protein
MVNRRLVFVTSMVATAAWSFTLGVFHARRADALDPLSRRDRGIAR